MPESTTDPMTDASVPIDALLAHGYEHALGERRALVAVEVAGGRVPLEQPVNSLGFSA